MRCRKVRSCLSAYCNDEITGRRKLAISEHLSTCSSCRKEETFYRALQATGKQLTGGKVSADFNSKLLNRIAQERFSETRRKAYMPKPAPRLSWGRLVPALASAVVVTLVGLISISPGLRQDLGIAGEQMAGTFAPGNSDLNWEVLHAQPVNNPNMMGEHWSLDNQIARGQRITDISNAVVSGSFSSFAQRSGLSQATSRTGDIIPFAPNYYRVRPIIKVYVVPESLSVKEVQRAY